MTYLRTLSALIGTMLIATWLLSVPAHAGLFEKGKALFEQVTGDQSAEDSGLSTDKIIAGLRETLRTGVDRVTKQLGQPGGFSGDPDIHIPLPDSLASARSALEKVGQGQRLDDLEQRINRAAEIATPKAQRILGDAIAQMSLADARRIYKGPDDAATQYFRENTSDELAKAIKPIVADSLSQAGVVKAYEQVKDSAQSLPFVPDLSAHLNEYVVDRSMDGIFHYLAKEEAQIRNNPAKRTSELLQTLYGNSQ